MTERIAYFDCPAGICGSMILGACVDAGVAIEDLRGDLARIPIDGYSIHCDTVSEHGVRAVRLRVDCAESHPHRGLSDIRRIIVSSEIGEGQKSRIIEIFTRLAEAEARIHDCSVDEVHFHEVGAIDAIVDISGAVLALDRLGITRFHSSSIATGTGFVKCRHGMMPVPAPATAELLRGLSFYTGTVERELTTPTGAAIVATLAESSGASPVLRVDRIGYGAGDHELPIPNVLRLMVGTSDEQDESESLLLLETNIDDSSPEFLAYAADRLREAGARDVWITPTLMKKNRPGFLLSVLADRQASAHMRSIIFKETTTIGVRETTVSRYALARDAQTVVTSFGPVRIKTTVHGVKPEYEDCARLAREYDRPIQEIYAAALAAQPDQR